MLTLPFKLNQDRRHRIPRQKRTVTNWREYDAGLRQRGSLTVWFTEEAVQAWQAKPRATRGGQPAYSPLAILTALTLRAVFRLPFRQTEGLIGLCGRPEGATLFSLRSRQDTDALTWGDHITITDGHCYAHPMRTVCPFCRLALT